MQDLDNMVKYLSEQLQKSSLLNQTDIILLSDHGMDTYYFNHENVDKNIINLYRTLNNDSCNMYGASPVIQVIANDGYNQTEICNKLKEAAMKNGNYKVYTDDELDENWHVRNEQRFGPCTVVADPGYVFQDQTVLLKKYTDYDKCKCFVTFICLE